MNCTKAAEFKKLLTKIRSVQFKVAGPNTEIYWVLDSFHKERGSKQCVLYRLLL